MVDRHRSRVWQWIRKNEGTVCRAPVDEHQAWDDDRRIRHAQGRRIDRTAAGLGHRDRLRLRGAMHLYGEAVRGNYEEAAVAALLIVLAGLVPVLTVVRVERSAG
ncbi:MAG: hypothetical protein R3E75_11705 [Steroidobacteraceae bacterium]|nr:hypothetical protein [Nevskiaceae bacterium]MCP5472962.1 hypothetical protein [Nevskiaceae bacterium]